MKKLRMKNNNMILTEKQQKYQFDRPKKMIKIIILKVKKYCRLIKVE